jgi:nucleoside phosphorylase
MATTRHKDAPDLTAPDLPDLPPVAWSSFGGEAPKPLDSKAGTLPQAEVIIITWAEAEWAAMQQVFVDSKTSMPYSDRNTGYWDGWHVYDWDRPSGTWPSGWDNWGYYRLVEVRDRRVLLFKSNTHLDWPGESYLEQMTKQLIEACAPTLLLSIGTAGGAEPTDHEGTVRIVSSGRLYNPAYPTDPSKWTDYANDWTANSGFLGTDTFNAALFAIPTTKTDLESLAAQYDGGKYSLGTLDANGLCYGDAQVQVHDMTPKKQALVTTATFVVATNAANSPFSAMACVEMDDAIIGKVCNDQGVSFGFVRNISDPVQNAELPASVQGDWGGVIYKTYGLFTSYNGALAAWAAL